MIFTTKLDETKSYAGQMRQASRDMWNVIKDYPIANSKFSSAQLDQLCLGKKTIDGYTWHHNPQSAPNNFQLLPEKVHNAINHIGEGALSGGK